MMTTTTTITTTTSNTKVFAKDRKTLHEWLAAFDNGKAPSNFINNPKLTAEIHSALIQEPSNFTSEICDHLFTLHHDVKHRPFVFQFLPSFVIVYYDVLYDQSTSTKDVCSTIDTFLVSLYNLSVTDDAFNEKIPEFRIPNLTLPSIYHTPNLDHYTPTPLTQQAISKHETKCEVIRLQSFIPFDTVNRSSSSRLFITTSGEQILYFLLIQYGGYVSFMDQHSRQSYIDMSKKLLGQGFSFDREFLPSKNQSVLPGTGRRIHVSSRIMSELLGTLLYLKSTSSDRQANDCMRLLKHRAEYEMYSDVILMTESMNYLREFETQRPERQDSIGIEIESAPTIELIRQKRSATTTRSIKTRQHKTEQIENSNPMDSSFEQLNSSPIDEVRTNISSSIGPVASTPSPRQSKPVSLTSTDTFFKNFQPRLNGNLSDDQETVIEETYL